MDRYEIMQLYWEAASRLADAAELLEEADGADDRIDLLADIRRELLCEIERLEAG